MYEAVFLPFTPSPLRILSLHLLRPLTPFMTEETKSEYQWGFGTLPFHSHRGHVFLFAICLSRKFRGRTIDGAGTREVSLTTLIGSSSNLVSFFLSFFLAAPMDLRSMTGTCSLLSLRITSTDQPSLAIYRRTPPLHERTINTG